MLPIYLAVGGLIAGLVLFGRGVLAYTRAQRIAGLPSSSIASIAAGEVRVSGVVEPDAALLVSPLQSERCVWYRARVEESSDRSRRVFFAETRAVGFRVKDATGTIRVFPRDASVTAPDDFHGGDDFDGEGPAGLRLNTGPTLVGVTEDDHEARIADLLTVHGRDVATGLPLAGQPTFAGQPTGARSYAEARIAPGDPVTVIGWAVPFGALGDPAAADASATADAVIPPDDPALVADLAEARAAGTLADSAEEAWGNAAIPGFGIGRPVRPPELDPDVRAAPVDAAEAASRAALAARVERRFEIRDDELVLAAGDGMPLAVYDGEPAAAAGREQNRFLLGLGGAVLAIVCAMALAYLASGATLP